MKFGCFFDHDLSQDQRQADHITRNTAMASAWHLSRQLLDDAVDLVGFNTAPRFKAAAFLSGIPFGCYVVIVLVDVGFLSYIFVIY